MDARAKQYRDFEDQMINVRKAFQAISPIHFDAKAYHSSEVYQMKDEVKQRTVAYLEKKEDEAKVRELEKRAETFRNFGPKALKTGWKFYINALKTEWEFYNSVQEGGMDVLIKNDPFHKAITNEQNSLTRGLSPKQSKTINWPMIEDDIYPSTLLRREE